MLTLPHFDGVQVSVDEFPSFDRVWTRVSELLFLWMIGKDNYSRDYRYFHHASLHGTSKKSKLKSTNIRKYVSIELFSVSSIFVMFAVHGFTHNLIGSSWNFYLIYTRLSNGSFHYLLYAGCLSLIGLIGFRLPFKKISSRFPLWKFLRFSTYSFCSVLFLSLFEQVYVNAFCPGCRFSDPSLYYLVQPITFYTWLVRWANSRPLGDYYTGILGGISFIGSLIFLFVLRSRKCGLLRSFVEIFLVAAPVVVGAFTTALIIVHPQFFSEHATRFFNKFGYSWITNGLLSEVSMIVLPVGVFIYLLLPVISQKVQGPSR